MIVNMTRLTVTSDKRIELVQTIRRLLGSTRSVKGCGTFCFYLDAVDENSSLLMSEWETESDLRGIFARTISRSLAVQLRC